MPTPTIHHVAELAGVSVATVSRTLAQPGKVRAETREKVHEAIKALGFVPNLQAVDFRRRATRTVILLVRDISNPFYLDIYKGVEDFAFTNGYKVLMGDAANDDSRVTRYVDMVRNRQADGLILMTGWLPEAVLSQPLPPITIALEANEALDLPSVVIDNRAAARTAVDYLISLGHRRIAHITGPVRGVMMSDRYEGYLDALRAAGIAADPSLVYWGDFHFAAGEQAVRALLARKVAFTALFASNDEMAVGAVNELRRNGLSVPADVSIVGFDDVVFAMACDPPLTTISQKRAEIGQRAMQMMIEVIEDRPLAERRVVIPYELIVRGSTAPVSGETSHEKHS